jgi:hypothetical protein
VTSGARDGRAEARGFAPLALPAGYLGKDEARGTGRDVRIAVLREDWADPGVPLPSYETAGAAGADVRANLPEAREAGMVLAPGARALVPTGLRLEIPEGFEVQVRPRSGSR